VRTNQEIPLHVDASGARAREMPASPMSDIVHYHP
jgi:hypothetical protein